MQLVVGVIGRPHGVRGEVTVHVRTDDPDLRFAPGKTLATDPASVGPLTVERSRWHKDVLLLTLAGVTDRNAAEALRGTMLLIDSAEIRRSDDPDEFHDHELVGLAVVTTQGERVGEVVEVLHYGQDLLVVNRPDRGQAYIPFVRALVPDIDIDAGVLVVDPPPGLLDLAESE